MFRIKTDIRQYKCENKAKVEKLIHNWVVRPTDLIFDNDDWSPIGDHPEFLEAFRALNNDLDAESDTLISSSSPESAKEPSEDTRKTDVFNQDDIMRDLDTSSKELQPPVAPEGVEPPRVDDEVTMMTDRTLDMLMDYDPSLENDSESEDTGVKEKPSGPKSEALSESSVEVENDVDEDDEKETTEKERTESLEENSAPKLGRHDLPEEFFATNEISKVNRADVEKRDDLNESSIDDLWSDIESDYSDPKKEDESEGLSENEESESDLIEESLSEESLAEESLTEKSDAKDESLSEESTELEQGSLESDAESSFAEDIDETDFHEDKTEVSSEPLFEEDEEVTAVDKPPQAPEEVVHINGYNIDFPFPIGPTPEDIKIGLKPTKLNRARLVKTFPIPEEKEYKVPHQRNFEWKTEPPKDLSVVGFGVIILVVILLVLLVAQC